MRLQSQLQVEDVVDDVLQDLHFADPLVGRDGGHQPPQPAVTVIHIALQAQGRRLLAPFAAAVLGQAPQRRMPATAARPGGLRLAPGVPDGAHGFHGAAGTERDRDLPRHLLPRPRARAARPPPRNASGARARPRGLSLLADGSSPPGCGEDGAAAKPVPPDRSATAAAALLSLPPAPPAK